MLKKIEQLRKEPKQVRDRYALYGALCVTTIIATAWLITVPAKFETIVVTPSDTQSSAAADAWQDVSAQLRAIGSVFDAGTATGSSQVESAIAAVAAEPVVVDSSSMTDDSTVAASSTVSEQSVVLIGTTSVPRSE